MERIVKKMTPERVVTNNKLTLTFDFGDNITMIQSVGFVDRMEHYSWSEFTVTEGGPYWESCILPANELRDTLNGFLGKYELTKEQYEAIELFFK